MRKIKLSTIGNLLIILGAVAIVLGFISPLTLSLFLGFHGSVSAYQKRETPVFIYWQILGVVGFLGILIGLIPNPMVTHTMFAAVFFTFLIIGGFLMRKHLEKKA